MLSIYILKRTLTAIATLFVISFISFVLVVLPPGDVVTAYLTVGAEQTGGGGSAELMAQIEALRARYGLDQPIVVQYARWMQGILYEGDFGYAFSVNRPVADFIWQLMGSTLLLIFTSLIFIVVVSLPIGFYSAVRQYSIGDYVFTFFGFLGLAMPNFLLALTLLFLVYMTTGDVMTGLSSPGMNDAPMNWEKIKDMAAHLWIPTLVIGTAGTAAAIRILRNNMLDELNKPYVQMARAKGVNEWRLLVKYPFRIAINPLLSTVGFILPDLFGATIIVSIVLALPTIGPIYLDALLNQDMFLAGSIVLLIGFLTVVGTLISDILLAIADPRIRLE